MLEITRRRPESGPLSPLQTYLHSRRLVEPARFAPSMQLLPRDAFVAETAIKLDRMLGEMKSIDRDLQLVKSDLAQVRADLSQNQRFSEFLERDHKLRATKLDELGRRFDYLTARLDAVDGRSNGDFQSFRTFEAVSRRLTELGSIERDFRAMAWKLRLSMGLFAASLASWVITFLAF